MSIRNHRIAIQKWIQVITLHRKVLFGVIRIKIFGCVLKGGEWRRTESNRRTNGRGERMSDNARRMSVVLICCMLRKSRSLTTSFCINRITIGEVEVGSIASPLISILIPCIHRGVVGVHVLLVVMRRKKRRNNRILFLFFLFISVNIRLSNQQGSNMIQGIGVTILCRINLDGRLAKVEPEEQ